MPTTPLNTRRPNLDLNTFGASNAASILAEIINESGNGVLAKRVASALTAFSAGANEIIKMNDPMRTQALRWWYEEKLKSGNLDDLARYGIDSYFVNVMQARMRQFKDQGGVLEALRDRDPDHQFIVAELRKMRLAEDSQ